MITPLFTTIPSFAYLTGLYFRYAYSVQLETSTFANRTADYVYFHLLCVLGYNLASLVYPLYTFWEAYTLSIIYVWSKYNQDVEVRFFFGIRFKALYLPLVMVALDFFLGGPVAGAILGVVVGHVYFYAQEIYPQSHNNQKFFVTPQFIKGYFPEVRATGYGAAQPKKEPSRFSGTGYKLGG